MGIITIVGPRATGKSVVGKKLARKLGYKFIEIDRFLDEVLEKEGGSWKFLMEHGANAYYEVLHKAVKDLLNLHKDKIIFEGGYGSIYSEFPESKNIARTLKRKTKIVLLVPEREEEASIQILYKRERARDVWKDMGDEDLREKVRKDYLERIPGMKKIAHHTIHIEGRSPDAVAEEISKFMKP